MTNRQLHPREEPYRWAIEKLDEAFGREQVRVTPRQHYHVVTVSIFSGGGERCGDLVLRNPSEDLNRRPDREAFLERWIGEVRERCAARPRAVPRRR